MQMSSGEAGALVREIGWGWAIAMEDTRLGQGGPWAEGAGQSCAL